MPITRFLLLLCIFSLFYTFSAFGQFVSPAASSPSTVQQRIGLTNTTITYHRPEVKGRKIFDELLSYGELWRTGANEATKISFDRPVKISDKTLEAGTYTLFSIPGEDSWTWIINADTALWGAYNYRQERDVMRVEGKVKKLTERINTMELRWMNVSHNQADLTLEWEYLRATLPVEFLTHQQMEQVIQEDLSGSTKGDDFYQAAMYYLDNGLDLTKAKEWLVKKIELDGEHHVLTHYLGRIEYGMGQHDQAVKTIKKALEMAQVADNPNYVRTNERLLRNWEIHPTDLQASDVLEKSIKYHDPSQAWEQGKFEFAFHESRATTYLLTQVTMDNAAQSFELRQKNGKHDFLRYYGPEGCRQEYNGSTEIPEAIMKRFRLTCDRSKMYRNYYTYLWGLPMKLKDEGTIIDPAVRLRHFFGEDLYELKVTYEEGVGDDIWYFYFDQETFAMKGYRFYHDEAKNDGEYILLSEEAQVGSLRLPKTRAWYTHKDRRYLGTDELMEQ